MDKVTAPGLTSALGNVPCFRQHLPRQALQRGKARDYVSLEVRHATTVDDLRHALLDDGYEVLHFSGHGAFDALLFEDSQGKKLDAPLEAIGALVARRAAVVTVKLAA